MPAELAGKVIEDQRKEGLDLEEVAQEVSDDLPEEPTAGDAEETFDQPLEQIDESLVEDLGIEKGAPVRLVRKMST